MLNEEHRQYLRDAGITDAVIDTCGAESTERGISFLYRGPKRESRQLRPDAPGDGPKYLFSKGEKNFMNVVRDRGEGPLLIVEGTKQALAAASWADREYSVIGLAGCTLWHKHDWDMVDGRDVLICFDGDTATNRDVYMQAKKFGDELTKFECASSVAYVQIPDGDGLDDHLADADDPARALVKLVRRAGPKPADSIPPAKPTKSSSASSAPDMPETGGRELVAVNGDLKEVVDNIIGALKARWDGHHLFNYGQVLTCLEGPATLPLEEGTFLRLLADTVYMVDHHPATQRAPERYVAGGRIDNHTKQAVMAAAAEFTTLSRVVRAPFVRPDGTVCTTPGYDEATQTILIDDPLLSRVKVPDEPTPAELSAAVSYLMDEWLGDMPFPTEGDRANALALLVTPFVRGMFPLAPMAVVNGLQMGVGKNLFADCVAVLATGKPAEPMPYTRGNDDEVKKVITSAFRTGSELFVFDEAHVIEGSALARALTSITYMDRILGASVMAQFPNQVTWMALGNQVQVNGDVARRVYWIELRPTGANPQDRRASTFRHPDIRAWMDEHRPELVSAVLTIIRSWFAAGQPQAPRSTSLGSFEGWDRTVGGIVTHAGLNGFLGEIQEKRSETDFESAYWTAHIAWLWSVFGAEEFTTAGVRDAALANPREYEAPPKMEDVAEKGYTRELGKRYAQKKMRWYDGRRLVKAGMGHKSTLKWRVEAPGEGDMDGTEVTPTLNVHKEKCLIPRNEVIHIAHHIGGSGEHPSDTTHPSTAFDAETCSAAELHKRADFVRLSAATGLTPTTDHSALIDHLMRAEVITGHNILGFDLIALARHHGADYEALSAKAVDTLLVEYHRNPIAARGVRENGFYKLDAMAARYGVEGKSDDIKRLARRHGGFDRIPLDDEEYRAYLEGDVATSERVYEKVKESMDDPYLQREHRVQTIMGRITLEGFRVDEELVWGRYQRGRDRLEVIQDRLHRVHGLPLDSSMPHRTNAGKAALYEALVASGISESWLAREWPRNKDGSLNLGKETLTAKSALFHSHGKTAAGEICDAVMEMNGVRTVYGTVIDWMTGGRVHPSIAPLQASGRWSVQDPGLTVMGKRGGKHVEREIFLPEPGHVMMAFDLDQVDMRAVAGMSGDREYMKLFAPGRDVHSEIAAMVGLPREESKAIGHGWNYGESINKMVAAGVRREAAEQFDLQMRENFPRLVKWQDEVREEGGALPYGEKAPEGDDHRIFYNGYGRPMRVERERAYTQAPALMGQGTTRDIVAEGLLHLPFEVRKMLRAVIHDEVVLSIPADSVEDVKRVVLDAFTFDFKGVPITCGSSKAGANWGAVYSK